MANLVLRSFYISPKMDAQLRTKAFYDNTSKNDLIRRYLELGMAAVEAGKKADAPAARAAARTAPAAKRVSARQKAAQGVPAKKAAAKNVAARRAPARKAAAKKAVARKAAA